MKLSSAQIRSFKFFFGLKQLMKAIPSINHAASSSGIVCNASESVMM